ncbi:MAG TPA: helix-hairpin-helix domain-containing protein [Thermomicrobiales bacterium]
MENRQIAAAFRELADLMDIAGEDRFRVSAYRRASDTIRHEPRPLAELAARHQIQSLPGIGPAIGAEIAEMLTTGEFARLTAMREALPAVVIALMRVPGIGPKTAASLHARFNLPDLASYEQAFQAGALKTVKGIGAHREAEILSGLHARIATEGRILLGTGVGIAAKLIADFHAMLPDVSLVPIGSLRRWASTLGDVDLLAATDAPETALDGFATLPDVLQVVRRDVDVIRVRLIDGAEAECITRPTATVGGALLWLTGNTTDGDQQGFREALAAYAAARGFTLDGAGLRRGDTMVEGDERDAFTALGLPFIPPELREGEQALETIIASGVPRLLELGDIRGDLHTHSVWSDGTGTIAEMVATAREHDYAYYGVSDHSYSLRIANGLDPERLRQQRAEVDALDARITVFCSCEMEVHSDGHLDLDDTVLATLDYAIASVHSGQRGDRETVTRRTLAAIRNPYVDIIAHPTGRMPLHREPMDLDLDAVIGEAVRTETSLEINADYHRLDLDAPHAKRAADAGVILTINSDAHSPAGLGNMIFGVMTARRAWLTPHHILNCWPAEDILARRARRVARG